MKRLLEFVNESQDTTNIASNNKNIPEVCDYNNNYIYYMHITLKCIKTFVITIKLEKLAMAYAFLLRNMLHIFTCTRIKDVIN